MNIKLINFEETLSLYQWHFDSQTGNKFSSEKVVPLVSQQIPSIGKTSLIPVHITHLVQLSIEHNFLPSFFPKRCTHHDLRSLLRKFCWSLAFGMNLKKSTAIK